MHRRIGEFIWVLVVAVCFVFSIGGLADEYFVFASLRGNGEDGLHPAISTNGHNWQALNHDRSFLKPAVGAYKIMRDPCLAEGPDGTCQMVWTSGWTADKGKIIGYAPTRWRSPKAIGMEPC